MDFAPDNVRRLESAKFVIAVPIYILFVAGIHRFPVTADLAV